ncbi:MAG: hypothetical protein HQL67_02190 [Magnetococcales bacterium]|nr:hypothetical protein [Magnetococcales bacterium]
MNHLDMRYSVRAGAAVLAAALCFPLSAQADMAFLAHPAPTALAAASPTAVGYVAYGVPVYSFQYQIQAPTYYYVPVTPTVVTYAVPTTVIQSYYVPAYTAQVVTTPVAPVEKKTKKEPEAKPTVESNAKPIQLYSNFSSEPSNPVVMVYPPLVMGFGQPLIMW